MKSILFLTFLNSLFLFSSCAPRVITSITKTYPVSTPSDSVVVFQVRDAIPIRSEPIGRVYVEDTGSSIYCNYNRVLHLAKKATSKSGGNGFLVTDHLYPSIWSSCHQISGIMLRIDGNINNDSLYFTAEQKRKIELLDEKEEIESNRRLPSKNIVTFNIGYGCIERNSYSYSRRLNNCREGVEWKFEYDRITSNYIGFGFQYSGFKSSLSNSNLKLSYLAPLFVYGMKFDEKFILKGNIGAGLFFYEDDYASINSIKGGISTDLGVEYMLTPYIGLGITGGWMMGGLEKQEGRIYLNDSASKEDYASIFNSCLD